VALSDDESALVTALAEQIEGVQPELARLDGYYEGAQRLEVLGLAVPPELRRFTTIVNWPRLAVDSIDERLDVEGFRYPESDDADAGLWRVWQANDLDEESQLAHLDALIFRRSFVCVGSNEADRDTPLVTVESPLEMQVVRDPRTRQVTDGLRLYAVGDDGQATSGTLYQRNATVWVERRSSRWVEIDRDEHRLGVPPVVPIVNRGRTGRRSGVSEMSDIITLTDAAARALTNAQVAAEALAVPQRGVLGASKGDFVNADGSPLTVWEAYFGAVWALENPNAKTFQFDAAQLSNFETIVNVYARQVASLTGLPPHYLGFTTDNPASADAIRSAESRLVKRCERKQRLWSGAWEQVMRLVVRFQTGEFDPAMRQLETLWRDPSTPTRAQAADATVKLVQANILPIEAAWEDLGYSAARRARLRDLRAAEANDPVLERVARDLIGGGVAPAANG
jgi:hypothetical protein